MIKIKVKTKKSKYKAVEVGNLSFVKRGIDPTPKYFRTHEEVLKFLDREGDGMTIGFLHELDNGKHNTFTRFTGDTRRRYEVSLI